MARTQIQEEKPQKSLFDHSTPANVESSMFQLGRKVTFNGDVGYIMPIDLIECVPNDNFNISWRYILDTLPLAAPPFTPYRIRVHAYYCRYVDLWKGASTYLTKGRSGNITLQKPTIDLSTSNPVIHTNNVMYPVGGTSNVFSPMSLYSMMGLPVNQYVADATEPQYCPCYGNDVSPTVVYQKPASPINALPFFMYQKIYRRFYAPANLLQDNKTWFPDDITDHWYIDYDRSNLTNDGYFHPDGIPQGLLVDHIVPMASDSAVNIFSGRYACFGDDKFTTALPFQVRGTPPSLQLPVTGQTFAEVGVAPNASSFYPVSAGFTVDGAGLIPQGQYAAAVVQTAQIANHAQLYSGFNTGTTGISQGLFARLTGDNLASTGIQFNLNQLRQLMALSVWQERNTRTNGNYNSLIYSHFRENPDMDDFEPIYIGGSSDVIYFSNVIQQSESSGSNPLGSVAGLGHTDATGRIGNFHCKDYGYIMLLMTIMPDISYTQGIEKLFTRNSQEDEYFPEFNALGFQAVLNREVYTSGDITQENDVFGWNERNLEFKTRQSVSKGLFALPPSDSSDRLFSAYTQARVFNDQPMLSSAFVSASPFNLRRDWLAYPNLPAFKIDFATDIKARRPLPYASTPETFGF